MTEIPPNQTKNVSNHKKGPTGFQIKFELQSEDDRSFFMVSPLMDSFRKTNHKYLTH